jgi:hypothetical protein
VRDGKASVWASAWCLCLSFVCVYSYQQASSSRAVCTIYRRHGRVGANRLVAGSHYHVHQSARLRPLTSSSLVEYPRSEPVNTIAHTQGEPFSGQAQQPSLPTPTPAVVNATLC